MTIGKSSKKQKAPRSPPFLDLANGFYVRLDETESEIRTESQITEKPAANSVPGETNSVYLTEDQEHCVFDFSHAGMMDDDGTTLLERKPSRLSRRWSRKSSRRTKSDKLCLDMGVQGDPTVMATSNTLSFETHLETQPATESGSRTPEPMLIHFSIKEEADDQKLVPEGKQRNKELMEKRKEGEVEGKTDMENMKVIKRNTLRNYRKVLDKALRRGWETFVANLYSVTLSPVASSVSIPSKSEMDRKAVLAEFR